MMNELPCLESRAEQVFSFVYVLLNIMKAFVSNGQWFVFRCIVKMKLFR